ncbi:sulfite exporter TauE/SafE family protein [Rubrivivax rivuli]|uniref:Probable membrane transporter protein n=1 Tax=Rubrivivax rivuli TaxID=1862385 RepID=A0A437REP4_9BURK|nr:sulfite exporter TauE/SafE family protein [Rubrivivax rivuli]RVU45213.1 sulfite exporter TauE/SafE family protein [Rubrivivax rivuli]
MDLGFTLVAELLALGAVAGFLAGLLGIGGGMLMVPAMAWLLTQRGVDSGLAVKMAIATSMATILFTSLSSVRAHHRLGAVRWPIARRMAPGIVLGGLLAGAGAFAVLKGQGLALIFAAFIGYTAVQMALDRRPSPGREMPGAWGQAGVGTGIGFISGLLGAGGAFLSVPFMTWCNVPPRHAVGTSSALGFPIALASTVGYVISGWHLPPALPGAFGYLYLPALAIVAAASVALAPLGARVAQRINVKVLKRLFAVLLMALAGSMLHRGLNG